MCILQTVTECSSQGCSENSSDSFQNEKNLSQLEKKLLETKLQKFYETLDAIIRDESG